MAKGKYQRWITEPGLTILQTWARLGLTDEQLAHNIGISVKTLYEWKNAHNVIREVLTCAKDEADAVVENALYKRAIGYDYEEVTKERRLNKDGQYELVVTKTVTKSVVPDTTAQIFWLKNRKQSFWRENIQESASKESTSEMLKLAESIEKAAKSMESSKEDKVVDL